jgi:hypothetical protein
VQWCRLERETAVAGEDAQGDSTRVLRRHVVIHSALRPLEVSVTYRSEKPFEASSSWAEGGRRKGRGRDADHSRRFSWYAFPDTLLDIPVTLVADKGQTLHERIEVTYDTLAWPMQFRKAHTNFIRRTMVVARDTLRATTPILPLAENLH